MGKIKNNIQGREFSKNARNWKYTLTKLKQIFLDRGGHPKQFLQLRNYRQASKNLENLSVTKLKQIFLIGANKMKRKVNKYNIKLRNFEKYQELFIYIPIISYKILTSGSSKKFFTIDNLPTDEQKFNKWNTTTNFQDWHKLLLTFICYKWQRNYRRVNAQKNCYNQEIPAERAKSEKNKKWKRTGVSENNTKCLSILSATKLQKIYFE